MHAPAHVLATCIPAAGPVVDGLSADTPMAGDPVADIRAVGDVQAADGQATKNPLC
jgi:hypothetical protein